MALVKGPLFSIEARGKIADAMVHFPWKGRNCVRKWLKPANPRDIDQRIVRQKLAACGKNVTRISVSSDTLPDGSANYYMIKAKTPANNIWNAFFTKTVMDHVKDDANFTAMSAALGASVDPAIWACCSRALGFVALTGNQFATTISPELQLFMAGYAAYALGLCDATHSYSTYPSNWNTAVVSQFSTNFTRAY